MAKFEKVSKFAEVDINLPVRKTVDSAGYDMEVAEDVVIPSFYAHFEKMCITFKYFINNLICIINLADCCDCKTAMVRSYQYRLCLII